MNLPHGIPPIVHRRALWEPFIAEQWEKTQTEWDVKLEFLRDTRDLSKMERPGAIEDGIYDPDKSNTPTIFGIIATRNNRILMTYSGAIFALGDLDFRQYIETFGLYSGGSADFRFDPEAPAFFLATGLRNYAAFMGNVWVPPDMRGHSNGWRDWVRSLVMRLGMIGRAVNHGAFCCENIVYFSRDRHVRAGYTGVTERRAPGVIYKGAELMWLGYSSPVYAEELAQGHAA
jgi:hypothetical protein